MLPIRMPSYQSLHEERKEYKHKNENNVAKLQPLIAIVAVRIPETESSF